MVVEYLSYGVGVALAKKLRPNSLGSLDPITRSFVCYSGSAGCAVASALMSELTDDCKPSHAEAV